MEELIFGISGVRGIVGKGLTTRVAEDFGKAFGTLLTDKKIVVGRDARENGKLVKEAFVAGILSTGTDVVDIGFSPTPTVLLNIQALQLSGGAVITASHNPSGWNGVKFANKKGLFLNSSEIKKLQEIYSTKNFISNQRGGLETDAHGLERHKKAILDSVALESIRKKKFKVLLDNGGGVLAHGGQSFLEEMGCYAIEESTARAPEPTRENLQSIAPKVKNAGADIGFAVDPDGDRLSIITEQGVALGEEYTLPLVASWILEKRKGIVVTNFSTSRMVEDVTAAKDCSVIRTKVGEINVVERMLTTKAVLGGEGNGGIIDPVIHYTRDSLAGMARLLEYMAATSEKITILANQIPQYYMIKEKLPKPPHIDYKLLIQKLPLGNINQEDGLRVSSQDSWIHIRPSNTEPMVRIICESKSRKKCQELINLCKTILK